MGEKIVYAKLFKSVSYLGGKLFASSQSGKSSKSAKRQLPSSVSSEEDVVVDE